ncbi:MAG: UDP-3-O-acyl-N-acetylglucosamine deacetylase [Leptolyngbyaceae cyanobacterium SM2_5_2]|nr:UDP-3-O-acyl-N-acetylglucosamine deacetylase [Leptolyngbyaceae cyanobacterium SM2_5_2]
MASPDSLTLPTAKAITSTQHTLASSVSRQGVGLHSGEVVTVTLAPARRGEGRSFVRTDLPGQPVIPAALEAVDQTVLSTELRQNNATVRTVEHLLAALVGTGIDNARIEITGPEIPLLDGSALGWVEAIQAAGVVAQGSGRSPLVLAQPVSVQDGDAWVVAFPAETPRLTYGIDFEVAAIGQQWFSWSPLVDPYDAQGFVAMVAPARTFGLAHQIEYLQRQGLIKGGSLENALVCSHEGWLNPPLRFDNEPVRHKLLDLIGDLSLLGGLPQAHVVAYKASHRLHVALGRSLQSALACPPEAV